jgi:predicted ArsR family transcriptional regulator
VDEEERQMALFEDRAHQRARIFDALVGMRVAGGATSGELAKLLKLNSNSVRGRLSEMEAEGVVIRTKYHRRGVRRESALYRVVAITNVAVAGEVDHEAAR